MLPTLGALIVTTLLSIYAPRPQELEATAAVKACAATLGIELAKVPSTERPSFVAHLAWVSDVVAIGTVTEIRTDPGGPYRTLATIEVSGVRKGRLDWKTITLCLESGPERVEPDGRMVGMFVGGEPTVSVGETLFLFLTTDPARPEPDSRYRLLAGQYRWFNDLKLVIRDGKVETPNDSTWSVSLEEILRRVDEAVRVQASRCESAR